jgi:hypothetical protein
MKRWLHLVRDRYLAVDARTLGLFRICFGLHLLANLYDRTKGGDALAFYTNLGVLPNHFALFAPMGERMWSLLFPFSTPEQVQVALVLIALSYAMYVVGWHTKVAQVLVVVCLLSLTNRDLILQNGGIVVTNVVAIWTMFLPVGARFSVDHLLRSLRERKESTPAELNDRTLMVRGQATYARLAYFGILLNFACIYFFNYAHKTGPTWRAGSAVHWVLWQNRIATMWAAMLRMHEPAWLSPVLTRSTLVIEALLPVLILFPTGQRWTRRAAIVVIFGLHVSISLMMTLGPFSYSMMSFGLLLIRSEDWDWLGRALASKRPRRAVVYDPTNPRDHLAARILARLDLRGRFEFSDRREVAALSDEGSPRVYTWLRKLPLELLDGDEIRDTPARRFKARIVRSAGELLAGVILVTIVIEIGADNWIIPEAHRVKHRPVIQQEIVNYLRLPQGWSMFSPDAPKEDGTLVVDAVLSDGRHLDPRTQLPPDFDAAFHGPWYDDQQWCDWNLRMKWESNRHLHSNFREYIAHLDQLDSWQQTATIKYFDVYWVSNNAPPPGSTTPYGVKKTLLFTGGVKP